MEAEGQPFRAFTQNSLENGRRAEEEYKKKQKEEKVKKEISYKNKIKAPDPALEEGMPLPLRLQRVFPDGFVNTPIEEIDPYYENQTTFLVIDKRREIHRFNAKNTFWILDPLGSVRGAAINMTAHPLFSILMMVTVLINSFFLIIPISNTSVSLFAEAICLTVYTFEMATKIVARGFILHPFSYMRDNFNRIDFLVNTCSYMSVFLDNFTNISFLRSIRMFRLIRIDTLFPSFKVIVKSALKSDQKLASVYYFILACLSVVAIWFSQNYMGVLTQKCIRSFQDGNVTDENWETFVSNATNFQDGFTVCGNATGAGKCQSGFTCLQGHGGNPDYGYTNFDSFGWSLLGAFRLLTQDYWEDLYQMVIRATGPWHSMFFGAVIFLVSLNFLSLILAVVTVSYNQVRKLAREEDQSEPEVSSESRDTTLDIEELRENPKGQSVATDNQEQRGLVDRFCIWDCCHCWTAIKRFTASLVLNPVAELLFLINILLNTIFIALDHHDMDISLERFLSCTNYICVLIFTFEVISKIIAMSPKYYLKESWNQFDFCVWLLCLVELGFEGIQGLSILRVFRFFRLFRMIKIFQLTGSSWPILNYLISVIGKTMIPLTQLSCLLIIVSSVFGVVGMHLFGINYIDNVDRFVDGELPRWNFTDHLHSFMVIFRSICGEWIESMWDALLVSDISVVPVFILSVLFGGFVIKNLYLSLILHSFESCDHSTPKPDEEMTKILGKFAFPKFKMHKSEDETIERRNEARRWARLVENRYFTTAITTIIIISSLALTLEDTHLQERPVLRNILHHLDNLFMLLFIAEMLLKVPSLGYKRYFTHHWVDFLVVLALTTSCLSSIAGFGEIQLLKVLRILRLFQLLKTKRQEKIMVLDALTKAIPDVLGALVICLLIWLVFAIMGVQLFAGKFFKCIDDEGTTLNYEIIPDRNSCLVNNYTWANSLMNFDHVGNAYLSLVQVATFKGWIQIMNDAIDSREIDKQPIREVNIYMYLYFVNFIIYGVFLALNLFVGVIVRSYNRQKQLVLGDKSAKYYNAIKRIETKKPKKAIPKPSSKLLLRLYEIVTHKHFEAFMVVVVALNLVVVAMDHYQVSESLALFLDYSNLIFIVIFILECLVKIAALRHYYFLDSWNWFDFTLVLQQIISVLFSDFFYKYIAMVPLALVRVARVLKIRKNLRLVSSLKNTRIIFATLANSFCSLSSIASLLFVVMSTYAVFGMYFFKDAEASGALDDIFNFQTYRGTMLLLLQYFTWAGWDGALYVLMDEDNNYGSVAILYLVSFIFISFLISNVYIAVVLANYEDAIGDEEEGLTDEDVDMVYEVWQKFDPYATEYIRSDQLADFLEGLEAPFQFSKADQDKIDSLGISANKDCQIYYKDVVEALVRDFIGGNHVE